MNYDLLMNERLERFKQILNVLPQPFEIPAELLVLSAGEFASPWSYRHVQMPGQTMYFIFQKAGFTDARPLVWECADRELNKIMQDHFDRAA
ncbi:hypothetical protein [Mucilaginibacter pedocola]|uniref:Uncharacterized protein n=1 Tax=Mucilaginibacter pedocola TaxID=1792845 RepID=A0A1S9PKP2_9SPHI|nr:hypothetical protein [Mucilaginibacter pedocola]OOQ61533.1 hypothetical protein BC343_00180 [Mucilaginibacter pedocola]